MKTNEYPKLILPEYFTERLSDETIIKGFLSNVEVELKNGKRYILNFIDPVRLQQDLKMEVENGRPYFAERGMIVLPEVTVDNAKEVLKLLLNDNYFESLKPICEVV